jgi:DNA polymerase elongation subunit (family B)
MNPFNMKKTELQLYLTGHCKHYKPYQEHPRCYEREIGKEPRIGILDIETTWGFYADYGFMLCYALKVYHDDRIYSSIISKRDIIRFEYDERIVKNLVKDLKNFDIIITYNGTRFDVPYIRTRALKYKLDFPKYGFMKHIDLYYMVKYKLKIKPNTLQNACSMFGIKGKNHVDREIWLKASQGHRKSLEYVYDHCLRDVGRCTEKLYDKIADYSRKTNRSI